MIITSTNIPLSRILHLTAVECRDSFFLSRLMRDQSLAQFIRYFGNGQKKTRKVRKDP